MAKPTIANLNDAFRQGQANIPGKRLMTQGISSYPPEDIQAIVQKVRTFNIFTEENDPYGEHDFGSFEYKGTKIMWKLDYYDTTLTKGSEDPTDLTKTIRVLTIMLSSEY